jgi:hypothetical protein
MERSTASRRMERSSASSGGSEVAGSSFPPGWPGAPGENAPVAGGRPLAMPARGRPDRSAIAAAAAGRW